MSISSYLGLLIIVFRAYLHEVFDEVWNNKKYWSNDLYCSRANNINQTFRGIKF